MASATIIEGAAATSSNACNLPVLRRGSCLKSAMKSWPPAAGMATNIALNTKPLNQLNQRSQKFQPHFRVTTCLDLQRTRGVLKDF